MLLDAVGAVGPVDDAILKYIHAGTWAMAVAIGGYVVLFPLRYWGNKIAERFAVLDAVREELETQRTNALSTIQTNGAAQLVVLGRMAELLDKIHISQSELAGFIRAQK